MSLVMTIIKFTSMPAVPAAVAEAGSDAFCFQPMLRVLQTGKKRSCLMTATLGLASPRAAPCRLPFGRHRLGALVAAEAAAAAVAAKSHGDDSVGAFDGEQMRSPPSQPTGAAGFCRRWRTAGDRYLRVRFLIYLPAAAGRREFPFSGPARLENASFVPLGSALLVQVLG